MKLKFNLILSITLATAAAALADVPKTDSKPLTAPDRDKASYALGMNLGGMHKQSTGPSQTDIPSFLQAIKDVLDDKPTQLQESEAKALLEKVGVEGIAAQSAQDKLRVSYAGGMRMGLQIKSHYPEAESTWLVRGFNDVMEGKPTMVQVSEISSLLEQAMQWGKLKQSEKNLAEGSAFLTKNAKQPGIQTMADGLQYRIVKEGTGDLPNTNQMVYIKMRGTYVDGRQFIKHNHYLIRCGGGCQAWQDALPKMKIGSRWEIFVPPSLGFGDQGEPGWGVGPNATMIWDLEMVSIAPPNAEFGRGRLGHAFEDSDIPDEPADKPAGGTTREARK